MELKKYQKQAVDEFEDYLIRIRKYGEKDPHIAVFDQIQRKKHFDSLYNIREGINVPFVCIRIPTGGGKTVVACYLLNSLYQQYLKRKEECGLVTWLVPTDSIKNQTIRALKDPKHPYRQALDQFFSSSILVYDFNDAQSIKKADIHDNLCIIITTFSTFRIENTNARKAYEQNGNLLEHFQNISKENLLKDDDGNISESLVNVIRMNRPIVVLDESHNAQTKLSYKMLKDFDPIFILEYTATPRSDSNVLVHITAQQLKEEKMVKIPIRLHNIAQWNIALREGVAKRNYLEKIAKKEKGEYIRPIALIQAEQEKPNPQKTHVDKIKTFLIDDLGIPQEQIAIRTGIRNDLSDIDIYARNCPIRYIITVKALQEGWDNPFAYVLISVSNIGSKVSVEQTIGRILRLPKQREKKNRDLNLSYVYTSSKQFRDSVKSIIYGLERNGYSKNDIGLIMDDNHKIENREIKNINRNPNIADDNIKLPCIAINQDRVRRLSFHDDLLGHDFMLANQEIPNKFALQSNENRTGTIDIRAGDELSHSAQTSLEIDYHSTDFNKETLLNWLDRKIHRVEYSQADKRSYLRRIISDAIDVKKIPLSDLSNHCFTMCDIINEQIDVLELTRAKQSFLDLEKTENIIMNEISYSPGETLESYDLSENRFNVHLFERAGNMNDEELYFAQEIDNLKDHVMWWYRNIEKKDFYIQGWKKSRFYPDFIIKIKSGKYIIVEYKGEHLLTNDDTKYKTELGRKWADLAGDDYEFKLVSKNSINQFLEFVKFIS